MNLKCELCGADATIAVAGNGFCNQEHLHEFRRLATGSIDTDSYYTGFDDGMSRGRSILYEQVKAELETALSSAGSYNMPVRNALGLLRARIYKLEACDTLL